MTHDDPGLHSRRAPDHPAITYDVIASIVDEFYAKVRADARLGPIFAENLSAPWPEHLARMRAFWSSVMLKSGAYKGQPMPAHMRLNEVRPADFGLWLRLFRETVAAHCEPPAAACFIARAERIAESLQLAMFFPDRIAPPGAFRNGVLLEEFRPDTGLT
jgi:hemoglobin